MTSLLKRLGNSLASGLNPVEQGVHHHPGPAGPYACRSSRYVTPGARRDA
jgi:hypothetical protein